MRLTPFFSAHPLSAALAATLGLAIPADGNSGSMHPNMNIVIVVTSCADAGPGSLRDAVAMAPTQATIDVGQLPCADSTITLTSGAIPIDDDRVLTISGVPPVKTTTQAAALTPIIDGGDTDRIFDHDTGAGTGTGEFGLTNVVLRNGYAVGPGGCLRSNGDVVLFDSEVTGCTAHALNYSCDGGGLFVAGNLIMLGSRISGNTCTGNALLGSGGAYVSTVYMSGSTIADNTSVAGPGGLEATGTALISYSTISGNRGGNIGGAELGFAYNSPVLVINSTISGNQGAFAGGLAVFRGPLTMASTTLAFNTATSATGTGGVGIGYPATLQSALIANNLAAGVPSDVAGQCGIVACSPPVTGANNLIMSAHVPVPQNTLTGDPQLMPLANNGGTTLTHALGPGSPAIDHGNDTGTGQSQLLEDQRGYNYSRVTGAHADIGAFESGSGPDSIFFDGFDIEA